jgi:hypothetical protein
MLTPGATTTNLVLRTDHDAYPGRCPVHLIEADTVSGRLQGLIMELELLTMMVMGYFAGRYYYGSKGYPDVSPYAVHIGV